jgi:hypothetical protein
MQFLKKIFVKNLAKAGFLKSNSSNLKIQYKFTEYNKGNRAARWLAGIFGAGKGKLIIEIKYYDN